MDHMDISDTALADRPTWCRLPLVPAPSEGYQCTASVFHFSTEKGSSTGEMPRIPCKGGGWISAYSPRKQRKRCFLTWDQVQPWHLYFPALSGHLYHHTTLTQNCGKGASHLAIMSVFQRGITWLSFLILVGLHSLPCKLRFVFF